MEVETMYAAIVVALEQKIKALEKVVFPWYCLDLQRMLKSSIDTHREYLRALKSDESLKEHYGGIVYDKTNPKHATTVSGMSSAARLSA